MSIEAFNTAIAFVLPHEEEFARGHWGDEKYVVTENVEGDAGGLTKYGIDQAGNPGVDVANLTRDQAIVIYHLRYWSAHNLDSLPDKLAIAAFDVWVNGGHANLWLQHAYNVTHPSAPQLVEDGQLGPKSLAALAASDQDAILRVFLQERDDRFKALASRPSQAKFLAGWMQRDKDLSAALAA